MIHRTPARRGAALAAASVVLFSLYNLAQEPTVATTGSADVASSVHDLQDQVQQLRTW